MASMIAAATRCLAGDFLIDRCEEGKLTWVYSSSHPIGIYQVSVTLQGQA